MRWVIRHLWIGVLAIVLLSTSPTVTARVWADGTTGNIGDPSAGDGSAPGDPDVPAGGLGKSGGNPGGVSRQSGFSLRSARPAVPVRADLWRIQLVIRWLWIANHRAF